MNDTNSWKQVGKVKDAHGINGELYILIFSKEASWKGGLKKFALGEAFEVFEIERSREHKDGLIIKAKNISDRNQAEALKGQAFSIPASQLIAQKGQTLFLAEILGFEVQDRGAKIGPVDRLSSNGPQDLLVIRADKNDIEIPFVEAFIEKIDYEHRQILMQLPEGLLGINESSTT